jgi:hypothetical protein
MLAAGGRDERKPICQNQFEVTETAQKRAESHTSSAPPENEDRSLSGKKLAQWEYTAKWLT